MKRRIGELFGKAIVMGGGDLALQKHKLQRKHEILFTEDMLRMIRNPSLTVS